MIRAFFYGGFYGSNENYPAYPFWEINSKKVLRSILAVMMLKFSKTYHKDIDKNGHTVLNISK